MFNQEIVRDFVLLDSWKHWHELGNDFAALRDITSDFLIVKLKKCWRIQLFGCWGTKLKATIKKSTIFNFVPIFRDTLPSSNINIECQTLQ